MTREPIEITDPEHNFRWTVNIRADGVLVIFGYRGVEPDQEQDPDVWEEISPIMYRAYRDDPEWQEAHKTYLRKREAIMTLDDLLVATTASLKMYEIEKRYD